MKKIIRLLFGFLKFIVGYILFFIVIHFGVMNIVLSMFGENTSLGLILSAILDIIAVVGGVLFAFLFVTKKISYSSPQTKVVVQKDDGREETAAIPKKFHNKKDLPNGCKGLFILFGVIILIISVLFYWYALRPASIKKECSMVLVKAYSQEEKDIAKRYLEDNCQEAVGIADNIIEKINTPECFNSKQRIKAPTIGKEEQKRPANDKEYEQCLRQKGL